MEYYKKGMLQNRLKRKWRRKGGGYVFKVEGRNRRNQFLFQVAFDFEKIFKHKFGIPLTNDDKNRENYK
jgi:hypothetical protein